MVSFLLIAFIAYSQQRTENRWLIGRWISTTETDIFISYYDMVTIPAGEDVLVLNDDGTGKFLGIDIYFSIDGRQLNIFNVDNLNSTVINIYRINDQRVILSGIIYSSDAQLILIKKN